MVVPISDLHLEISICCGFFKKKIFFGIVFHVFSKFFPADVKTDNNWRKIGTDVFQFVGNYQFGLEKAKKGVDH